MPDRKDHQDHPHHKHEHKGDHRHGKPGDQPRANVVPPIGQQHHNNWKAHTERFHPQERHHQHIISPQIDSRRLNFNPQDLRQRRADQLQHQLQNQFRHDHRRPHHGHHGENFYYSQPGYPQFGPQFSDFNYGGYGRQHHHRNFRNPYDGSNNFYRDRFEDNYYYDGHHHRHHRHDHNILPFFIEGILGGLGERLFRELDKGLDKKQAKFIEDQDDNDISEPEIKATREDFSPDKQISMNLDFSPQGQTIAIEPLNQLDARFERTG